MMMKLLHRSCYFFLYTYVRTLYMCEMLYVVHVPIFAFFLVLRYYFRCVCVCVILYYGCVNANFQCSKITQCLLNLIDQLLKCCSDIIYTCSSLVPRPLPVCTGTGLGTRLVLYLRCLSLFLGSSSPPLTFFRLYNYMISKVLQRAQHNGTHTHAKREKSRL